VTVQVDARRPRFDHGAFTASTPAKCTVQRAAAAAAIWPSLR
jgi:hypothetical protein